jgi:hypothetical protein
MYARIYYHHHLDGIISAERGHRKHVGITIRKALQSQSYELSPTLAAVKIRIDHWQEMRGLRVLQSTPVECTDFSEIDVEERGIT